MLVRTIEQYCSLLLTTSASRLSISSLVHSDHGRGSTESDSNLYPAERSELLLNSGAVEATPVLHHLWRCLTSIVGLSLAGILLLCELVRVVLLDVAKTG